MNKTILIDMDGVLRAGDEPLQGCREFLNTVQEKGYHACIISNTTKFTKDTIRDFFSSHDISTDKIAIVTALDATIDYIKNHYKSADVYCIPQASEAFGSLYVPDSKEAVVIGDMGKLWTYDALNTVFRKVQQGAHLIAMQKNKFWKKKNGEFNLDAGAFVIGIEYATGKEATLLGKPSSLFFETAIDACQGSKDDFFMLGDDLHSDVEAAEKIGGQGILMMTGKTTKDQLESDPFTPKYVAKNLNEALRIIQ